MSIVSYPGAPGAAQSANGGKVYPFNNIGNVMPVTVLAVNPQRVSVTFHVPGTTNDILVYPTTQASGAALAPTVAAPGGAFRVFAGGSLTITGECQQAWAALSVAGTNQAFTAMESHV